MTQEGQIKLYQDLKILKKYFQKTEEILQQTKIKMKDIYLFIDSFAHNYSHDESFLRVQKFLTNRIDKDIFSLSFQKFLEVYQIFDKGACFKNIITDLEKIIDLFKENCTELISD
jgi:hypothetical protein